MAPTPDNAPRCPSSVSPFGWRCTLADGHDHHHQDDEHGGATWNRDGWLDDLPRT